MFGLASGGLGLIFLVFRTVVHVAASDYDALREPAFLYHLLGVALALSGWLACRSGSRSRGAIHAAEMVSLLGPGVAYQLMGWHVPLGERPELTVLLALSYSFMARSAYVPSTARRTLLLNLAVGLPLVIGTYAVYRRADETVLHAMSAVGLPGAAQQLATRFATSIAVWWSLTTILATAISGVIYGLRREVREARKLGQYTLEEKLGEGGMGVVYRARHAMLRRPTAVKLLPADKAGEQNILRFEREVQLTANLTHPNTVTVFDYGRTPEGVFYYAMELLDGFGLDVLVRLDGAQPPERALHVLDAVAGALAEAHEIGLVHRDVKPANIILCRQGGFFDVPKVVDFGLVKDTSAVGAALTANATLTGTPLYMAPEVIRSSGTLDARSDLYSLGAVGYFLVTGTHVFSGDNVIEVCSHHLHTRPDPPSARLGRPVPADVETLLLELLAKDPDERPRSAIEVQERVRRCQAYGAWDRERARRWWQQHGDRLRGRRSEDPTLTRGVPEVAFISKTSSSDP
jgi:serine/threonine-protein kinase